MRRVGRRDGGAALAVAGEGAVLFLERVSPALEHVDSSSGAIGTAVNHAIEELVVIIASAPVSASTREGWLERLWEAHAADAIPHIERLGDFWGEPCVSPEIAAAWADWLVGVVKMALSPDPKLRGFFHGTTACLCALFRAGRYEEILALVEHGVTLRQISVVSLPLSADPSRNVTYRGQDVTHLAGGRAQERRGGRGLPGRRGMSPGAAGAPLLEVQDLSIRYGRVQALERVSLEVRAGEVVSLLGANGAGKSTALRSISRIIPIHSGRIAFDASDISAARPSDVVRLGIVQVPEGRRRLARQSVRIRPFLEAGRATRNR